MAHFLKTYVTATQNIRNGNTPLKDIKGFLKLMNFEFEVLKKKDKIPDSKNEV